MMLGSHAGPLVRAEGREHLVTACDAPAVTPGSARVLIRLSSGKASRFGVCGGSVLSGESGKGIERS